MTSGKTFNFGTQHTRPANPHFARFARPKVVQNQKKRESWRFSNFPVLPRAALLHCTINGLTSR